jgi:hypothetical protein
LKTDHLATLEESPPSVLSFFWQTQRQKQKSRKKWFRDKKPSSQSVIFHQLLKDEKVSSAQRRGRTYLNLCFLPVKVGWCLGSILLRLPLSTQPLTWHTFGMTDH